MKPIRGVVLAVGVTGSIDCLVVAEALVADHKVRARMRGRPGRVPVYGRAGWRSAAVPILETPLIELPLA